MDLLNLNQEDFTVNKSGGFRDPNKLIPNIKIGNGFYKVLLRFLPYWENPKLSKYQKYSAILTHPVSGDRLFIDCPSTRNPEDNKMHGPSILWTIDSLLRKKRDENRDLDLVEEMKKWFNRYFNFTSPVYVHKDPQVQENNGRILIYSYGSKIEKLQAALQNPTAIDENDPELAALAGVQKCNVFSLVEGMDFFLVVKKGNSYGKDYSESKFTGKITPFTYMKDGQKVVCKRGDTPEQQKEENMKIAAYLKENTPNMSNYMYKPWDDSTYKEVANYLKAMIPSRTFMQEVIDKCRDQKINQLLTCVAVPVGDDVRPHYAVNTGSAQQPANTGQQAAAPQGQTMQQIDPEFESLMDNNMGVESPQQEKQPPASNAPSADGMQDEFDALMNGIPPGQ